MLIFSKWKDYYDHLAGVYGVDEKLVLDRTSGEGKPFLRDGVITLFIAGKQIQGYRKEDKNYWGWEQLDALEEQNRDIYKYMSRLHRGNTHRIDNGNPKAYNWPQLNCELVDSSVNDKLNCPIILHQGASIDLGSIIKHPNLIPTGIAHILPAHDIWLMLSEWLGKKVTENEKQVPIGDDKTRILSHGFDLKQSFRHRK